MNDDDSELRPELWSADGRAGRRGSFDPLVKVTTLAPALARVLDTEGGLRPTTSVEAGGTAPVAAYATALHETIHWWQLIGSTTGLTAGLTMAAQAHACAPLLRGDVAAVGKPVIRRLERHPEAVDRSHSAWKAASRWRDLEIANGLLLDPRHTNHRLRSRPFLFESPGHALAQHAAATAELIGRTVGVPPANGRHEWEHFIHEARTGAAPGFEADALVEFPIGAKQLLEGQARLVELQYRARAVESLSLVEMEGRGWLDSVYGEALDWFLRCVESELPEDPEDPLIVLFLLICDIAINPSRGYPSCVGHPNDWLACTHPGLRFQALCLSAARHKAALLRVLKTMSLRSYSEASAIILGRSGWLSADAVATEASRRLSTTDLWASVTRAEDVAVHLVLAAHQSFSAMKAELPHFFCWPAAFLTGRPGDDLGAYEQLLELLSPPFYTGLDGTGVDTVHLPEVETGAASSVANEYFRAIAVHDLVRQWLSREGPFQFDFAWKTTMRPDEVENLEVTFERSFGVRLRNIPVAPPA